jgi:ABC-type Fe3+ transport system permease subunit/sugar lactone lactonase YvrE
VDRFAPLLSLPVPLIVAVCCILPLAWMLWQMVSNPATLRGLIPSGFQLRLLGRTLLYSGSVAAVATLLSLPAALVLGRGRGWAAKVLWFALPVSLLMPSIAYAYGWSQLLRLRHVTLEPGGWGDVARCVLTLAAWLWPVPAGVLGLALRRVDVNLQQQALLDGALWRVTARQLAGPLAASLACATVLASQEFAVYEPTGISVVATEVRMVYETGLHSSPANPITQPLGASAGADAAVLERDTQRARVAGAVATALPLLAVVAVLGGATLRGARTLSAADDIDVGAWPRALDAGRLATALAGAVVVMTLVVPTAAMFLSLHRPFEPLAVLTKFQPQVEGSLLLASLAGGVALVAALSATIRARGWPLFVALATFLIGGQLLAIALIRLYNHRLLEWVYDAPPIVVMAYFARFGWLALLAAAVTRSRPWRAIRELAAVDGAGDVRTALHVVWPLAWPLLGAAAVLVMVLSLTEVPATVLISPLRPQPLTPMLMTWVHMLRYDDMLEGSLLLMGIVLVLAIVATALVALFVRISKRGWRMEDGGRRNATSVSRAILYPLSSILAFSALSGCGDPNAPDAIWLRTGTGPGGTVYPRCIDYSARDDTFFVVDRMARVQHLDHDGNYLGEWVMPEARTGKPTGVTVGPDGYVYLADTHYQRVVVYDPKTGKEVRRWGGQGTGPGEFIYPTDVAFDEKGNVFVSEYGDNDRIQVFDPQGKFLYTFGRPGRGPGELARPQSMVIDGGLVYVTDASNHRIAVFKTDGTFVRNMGSVGHALGQFRWPYGMAQDGRGNLVVCEFGNNRVQLVDKQTGRGLKTWGMPGMAPGELKYPWAVAVDKRGRIVTVDSGNNRLQVFEF